MTVPMKPTLRNLYYRGIRLVSGDHREVEIDGETATFVAETASEHREYHNFEENSSELPVLHEVLEAVGTGDTFFDVGAKLGLFSCLVGVHEPSAEPVLFEPHPGNAARCRENLASNDLDGSVHEIALSGTDGAAELSVRDERPGVGTHSLVDDDGDPLRVTTARVDTLLDEGTIPEPDVVKVDVEGAEGDVLAGLERTLREQVPRLLVIEVHTSKLEDESDVRSTLADAGYECTTVNERGPEFHLRAVRR